MVADMCNRKGLPWRNEYDLNKVKDLKELCKTTEGKADLFFGVTFFKK